MNMIRKLIIAGLYTHVAILIYATQ